MQNDPRDFEDNLKNYTVDLLTIVSGDVRDPQGGEDSRNIEIMWGDMGTAIWLITPDPLAASDFIQVLFDWSCGLRHDHYRLFSVSSWWTNSQCCVSTSMPRVRGYSQYHLLRRAPCGIVVDRFRRRAHQPDLHCYCRCHHCCGSAARYGAG